MQEEMHVVDVSTDANWAGCLNTRRSTSGGLVMLGIHPIRMYSKTQSVVALSSAESEFYATTKAATEGIGVMALFEDLGMYKKIVMEVDASAALGVIERRGIGRIRHLETSSLWLQEQEIRDIIRFHKVPGAENLADLFTKNTPRQVSERHLNGMKCFFAGGRAEVAAQLHWCSQSMPVEPEGDVKHGKVFNWENTDGMDIDDLIKHVDKKASDEYQEWRTKWANKMRFEMSTTGRGLTCTKCRQRGSACQWNDHWSNDQLPHGVSIRHHTKPRLQLFTPCKVTGRPCDIGQSRTTIGIKADGSTFCIHDSWHDSDNAHRELDQSWTGLTVFRDYNAEPDNSERGHCNDEAVIGRTYFLSFYGESSRALKRSDLRGGAK